MADPVLNEQPLEFGALFMGDIKSMTADLFCGRTSIIIVTCSESALHLGVV